MRPDRKRTRLSDKEFDRRVKIWTLVIPLVVGCLTTGTSIYVAVRLKPPANVAAPSTREQTTELSTTRRSIQAPPVDQPTVWLPGDPMYLDNLQAPEGMTFFLLHEHIRRLEDENRELKRRLNELNQRILGAPSEPSFQIRDTPVPEPPFWLLVFGVSCAATRSLANRYVAWIRRRREADILVANLT
jgi:hypothetical protein